MDTSVVFDVVCQTYIYYTTEVFILVLRSPLYASGSLPSSAGGFITVSLNMSIDLRLIDGDRKLFVFMI